MTTFADTDSDLFAMAAADEERSTAFAALDASDYAGETTEILRAILRTADRLAEFSANDVRPCLPQDVNTNRVGRCFALAQERGWISWVSMVKSTDLGTHGKRVNVYRRSA